MTKPEQTASKQNITCGVTVIVTSNTGQGSITFNNFSFFKNYSPAGFPPVVLYELKDGKTGTILTAMYQVIPPADFICAGTAVFNFPNGEPLTISWYLDGYNDDNKIPLIVPPPGYYVTGISKPTHDDGRNFTFTLTVVPQLKQ